MDALMDSKSCIETNQRLIYGDGTDKQTWLNWSGLKQLTQLNIAQCFPAKQRVVIIAPHPDDEIMGCAGLLQQLSALDRSILLIAVTNGTASHPHSSLYRAEKLNLIRPQETQAALQVLGIDNIEVLQLNIQDGAVASQLDRLYQDIHDITESSDVLVTTFHKDGHPDHEFTAQVVSRIAIEKQISCYEVLIWAWHWASPDDAQIPWEQALLLNMTAAQVELKKGAIACFVSQTQADESTGQPAILSQKTIQRILMPYEVYIHVQ